MKKYRDNFTEDEIKKALYGKTGEAQDILQNPDKWANIKKSISDFLHKADKIPAIGSVIDDLVSMVEMVDAYIHQEYTGVPVTSIVSAIAAILYVLSPIDLIPDVVPIVGFIDDAAVVLLVLKLGVGNDLKKFKDWQNQKRDKSLEKLQKMIGKEITNVLDGHALALLLLDNNDRINVIYTLDDSENDTPFDCGTKYLNLPTALFKDMFIEDRSQYLEFLNSVIEIFEFRWSPLGKLQAIEEVDFSQYEDELVLLEDN